MRKDFYRFTLKQLALLLFVVCILLGFAARYIRQTYEGQAARVAFQNLERAEKDLRAAIKSRDVELARDAIERGAQGRGDLLRVCINSGQSAMLALLLEYGVNPGKHHVPGYLVGDGPIVIAVASSAQPLETRKEMLDVLLKHGIDINAVADNQRTVMDIAVGRNDAPLCDLLREYGVPYGPREMAVFNRLAELKEAVADNPQLVHERFAPIYAGQDPTLLGLALSRGHHEVAQFLIDSGAPLDTVHELGQTLMHMAARGGDPDLVWLLAARGLDVNARDDWRDTPLTDSIWHTNIETAKALIEAGADVNARGAGGNTALSAALRHRKNEKQEIIGLLIAAGADPTIANDEGDSALDIARNCPPEIRALLQIQTAPDTKVE